MDYYSSEEPRQNSGEITYYVSVGVEKNSRSVNTSFKASVWVTSVPGASMEFDRDRLAAAQSVASAAAVLGANTLEQLATETVNQDDINAFKEAVRVVAHQMIARGTGPVHPVIDEDDIPF